MAQSTLAVQHDARRAETEIAIDLVLQKRENKKRAGRRARATGSLEENGVSKRD
jgi:hypothetical protein